MDNDICVIITARAGSKGIHRKNIYPILGKPLIAYSIEAAIKTKIENIIVSTDDINIENICNNYGIKCFDRNIDLALSDTPSLDVVVDCINRLDTKPRTIILLQPTSPLVYPCDILEAVKVIDKGCDSCISVNENHYKIWEKNQDFLNPINHNLKDRLSRQQSKPNYIETGSIYATTYNNLIKTKQLISGNIGFIKIPKIRSFEIDDYEDLFIIESILKNEKSFFNL